MPRVKKPAWTNDEVVNLVGYLDHYIKKRKEGGRWSDSEILCKIASHIKTRSANQIQGKLLALYGESGTALAKDRIQRILKFGSCTLKLLPNHFKLSIRNVAKAIEYEEESTKIRTPQTLRSGKERSISIEPRWLRSSRSVSKTRTPSALSTTELRKPALRQRDVPAKLPKIEVNDDFSALTGNSSDLANIALATDLKSKSTCVEIANSDDGSPPTDIQTSSLLTTDNDIELTRRRLFGMDDVSKVPVLDYDCIDDATLPTKDSNSDHTYELLRDLLEDNRHLRKTVLQLGNELERAKTQTRILHAQSRSAHSSLGPQSLIIQDYQQQIEDLKRSIKSQDYVLPFLQNSSSGLQPSDFNIITDTFDNFRSAIYHLIGMGVFKFKIGNICHAPSPTLTDLLLRIWAPDTFLEMVNVDISQFLPQIARSKLAACLTAAAVCQWIFLCKSRCAILLTTPVHEKFHELLRAGCGAHTVRSLDILTYQSLIREQDFKEVYANRTAEHCTERLLEIFCELSSENSALKRNSRVKQQIRNIFLHALMLKFELMLREEKFRINWSMPGSTFPSNVMDIYEPERSQAAQIRSGDGGLAVTLTLVPGLQGYSHCKERVEDTVFFEDEDSDTATLNWTLQGKVSIK